MKLLALLLLTSCATAPVKKKPNFWANAEKKYAKHIIDDILQSGGTVNLVSVHLSECIAPPLVQIAKEAKCKGKNSIDAVNNCLANNEAVVIETIKIISACQKLYIQEETY